MAPESPQQAGRLGQAYVRVTGTRRDSFVEFEFSINDADLTVELIMPFKEFEEFCARENVTLLPPEAAAGSTVERFLQRETRAGRLSAEDGPSGEQEGGRE